MAYICYIYQGGDEVPYMEVLGDISAEFAEARLRQILRDRPRALRGELWEDDRLAVRLRQDVRA
jgi:hypothetical protein